MSQISRLGSQAATLTKFIVDRAKEVQAPYVLIGASALIIRGVIRRETKDLDFNIAPRKSADMQDAIRPHLQATRNEAVLIDGKTSEAKAAQTSFRIFKQVDPRYDNVKVDFSENLCAVTPNAYTEIDGIYVATVPLMVIFKMCAIARQNRSTWSEKLIKDAEDFVYALRYLKARNEAIPPNLLGFLAHERPQFLWANFWNAMTHEIAARFGLTLEEVEQLLHDLGVANTRD